MNTLEDIEFAVKRINELEALLAKAEMALFHAHNFLSGCDYQPGRDATGLFVAKTLKEINGEKE